MVSQKRRRFGFLRWWLAVVVVGLGVGIAGWSDLRKWLTWVEKKHFERMGRQGPLVVFDRGRWSEIHDSLWYRRLSMKRRDHWSQIHLEVLRLAPDAYRLQPWYGKPQTVGQVLQATHALAAINGGIFDPQRRPLGLFKQEGILINRSLNRRSIDGVFFLRRGQIGIERGAKFRHEGVTWAFQSAPLLIAEGQKIPIIRYADKVDRRSALCIDHRGHLLLMATRGFLNGLTYREMGDLMQEAEEKGGFGCRWGLNLDGGNSTQMGVRLPSSKGPSIRGFEAVPLFFLIFARSKSQALR